MLRSYGTMHTGDYQMIEVAYECTKKNKAATVYFEKPDAVLGFKMFTCDLPSYTVKQNIGFNQQEVQQLLEFCRYNAVAFLTDESC